MIFRRVAFYFMVLAITKTASIKARDCKIYNGKMPKICSTKEDNFEHRERLIYPKASQKLAHSQHSALASGSLDIDTGLEREVIHVPCPKRKSLSRSSYNKEDHLNGFLGNGQTKTKEHMDAHRASREYGGYRKYLNPSDKSNDLNEAVKQTQQWIIGSAQGATNISTLNEETQSSYKLRYNSPHIFNEGGLQNYGSRYKETNLFQKPSADIRCIQICTDSRRMKGNYENGKQVNNYPLLGKEESANLSNKQNLLQSCKEMLSQGENHNHLNPYNSFSENRRQNINSHPSYFNRANNELKCTPNSQNDGILKNDFEPNQNNEAVAASSFPITSQNYNNYNYGAATSIPWPLQIKEGLPDNCKNSINRLDNQPTMQFQNSYTVKQNHNICKDSNMRWPNENSPNQQVIPHQPQQSPVGKQLYNQLNDERLPYRSTPIKGVQRILGKHKPEDKYPQQDPSTIDSKMSKSGKYISDHLLQPLNQDNVGIMAKSGGLKNDRILSEKQVSGSIPQEQSHRQPSEFKKPPNQLTDNTPVVNIRIHPPSSLNKVFPLKNTKQNLPTVDNEPEQKQNDDMPLNAPGSIEPESMTNRALKMVSKVPFTGEVTYRSFKGLTPARNDEAFYDKKNMNFLGRIDHPPLANMKRCKGGSNYVKHLKPKNLYSPGRHFKFSNERWNENVRNAPHKSILSIGRHSRRCHQCRMGSNCGHLTKKTAT